MWKNDFTVGVSIMMIRTLRVYFFECSFIKKVWSVIYELDEVSISNFVKFQFQRMTLKIERVFEEEKNTLSKKTGQNGYEFSYQKGPHQMQNILFMCGNWNLC